LFFYLIAQIGAARAAVITYVNPAVAALLGVTVLHESFGAGAVLGLALILLGSWLATHSGKPKDSPIKETVTGAP
jgi:drug/metabolite transporter (DMT)-like permease